MKTIYSPAAIKGLQKLPKRDAAALVAKIDEFAADPLAPHGFAKAFGENFGRIRYGNWRAAYRIEIDRGVVVIEKAGHRKDIYR